MTHTFRLGGGSGKTIFFFSLVFVILSYLASCGKRETAKPQEEAQAVQTCETNSDCPEGLVCSPEGKCVSEEECVFTFYRDQDGDGFSDGVTEVGCTAPEGFTTVVKDGFDCNDNDPRVNPASPEICDGKDNNCNGSIDEGVKLTFYRDADGDGYGNPASSTTACLQPEGYVSDNSDCDDTNPRINPKTVWYKDQDEDGYTDGTTQVACQRPAGYSLDVKMGDCADTDPNRNPAASESCNGIDDDCDGIVDDGAKITFYRDADGDGYGYVGESTQACVQPAGYVQNSSDCDDSNPNLNPKTIWYKDEDGDGYTDGTTQVSCQRPSLAYTLSANLGDCDDKNASAYPGASEVCDGADNDCDGQTDEGLLQTFYLDQDGDGYGTPLTSTQACSQPSGYVSNSSDCDDTDPNIPSSSEALNGKDDDCDDSVDEGLAPSNLVYTQVLSDTVRLSWLDNSPNEREFVIEVSTDSFFDPPITFVSVGQNITTADFSGLSPNTTYYFRVYAKNQYAQTGYSNTLSVKTKPPYFTDAMFVSAGGYHTCAIKTDYSLWCWGRNDYGQVGIGTNVTTVIDTPQFIMDGVTKVSAGEFHTCAIKTDGTLWCWGRNLYGQLGLGDTTDRYSPTYVTSISNLVDVSAGSKHTCALKSDRTLWCWGDNSTYQLGLGDTTDRYSPVQVTGNIVQVSAGYDHTCAIDTNDNVWCWGADDIGQVGNGGGSGDSPVTKPVQVFSGGMQISAGYRATCLVTTNNLLYIWGSSNDSKWYNNGYYGTRYSPFQLASSIQYCSVGYWHHCRIASNNTLFCAGDDEQGQVGNGGGFAGYTYSYNVLSDVLQVSAGYWHTCAIKIDRSLWCWGDNGWGQLGNANSPNDADSPVGVQEGTR